MILDVATERTINHETYVKRAEILYRLNEEIDENRNPEDCVIITESKKTSDGRKKKIRTSNQLREAKDLKCISIDCSAAVDNLCVKLMKNGYCLKETGTCTHCKKIKTNERQVISIPTTIFNEAAFEANFTEKVTSLRLPCRTINCEGTLQYRVTEAGKLTKNKLCTELNFFRASDLINFNFKIRSSFWKSKLLILSNRH